MRGFRNKIGLLVTVLGYMIAIFCSAQIATVPIVLFDAYTTVDLPRWSWWMAWALSYVLVAIYAVKLSRMRFGTLIILAAAVLAFAITDVATGKLNQKYRTHEQG